MILDADGNLRAHSLRVPRRGLEREKESGEDRLRTLRRVLLPYDRLRAGRPAHHRRSHKIPRQSVKTDLAQIQSELSQFHLECGRYPTTEEGLKALTSAPDGLKGWRGPYTDKPVVDDPWGNPYLYEAEGDRYTLTSYGADGQPEGEGYDADVTVSPAD